MEPDICKTLKGSIIISTSQGFLGPQDLDKQSSVPQRDPHFFRKFHPAPRALGILMPQTPESTQRLSHRYAAQHLQVLSLRQMFGRQLPKLPVTLQETIGTCWMFTSVSLPPKLSMSKVPSGNCSIPKLLKVHSHEFTSSFTFETSSRKMLIRR